MDTVSILTEPRLGQPIPFRVVSQPTAHQRGLRSAIDRQSLLLLLHRRFPLLQHPRFSLSELKYWLVVCEINIPLVDRICSSGGKIYINLQIIHSHYCHMLRLCRFAQSTTPFPPPMASVHQRQATSMVATANSNSRKQELASTSISKVASAGVRKV